MIAMDNQREGQEGCDLELLSRELTDVDGNQVVVMTTTTSNE